MLWVAAQDPDSGVRIGARRGLIIHNHHCYDLV
jgi:hypothetical protein